GVVKSGAGRAVGNAEDPGNLRQVEARKVPQHEDRALLWVEALEAALQLVAIGDRQKLVGPAGQIGRQDPKVGDEAALTRRLANAGTNDEAVKPRVEPIRIAESGQVTPSDHQRVLDGILGSVDIAEDPLRERVEPVATRADQVGVG